MKKILVIEDNEDVRDNLQEILSLSNYEVFTAENGLTGVELALKEQPDLIICDVMMPELDGFGVLHILSKKPKTSDIPFIFLTAKAEKGDFRTGMNLGADDYITKPYNHVELLDAIQIRLEKSERIKKISDRDIYGFKTLIDEVRGQKALEELAEQNEVRTYRKKELIYREGEHPKRLYYVNSGKVKTFMTNDVGKEFITGVFKEGDFLGFKALIQDTPYQESAAALEEAELSLVPKTAFIKLLYGNRDFSARFIKMLAKNVAEKEEQLLQLAYNSIRKRVADALVTLHQRYQNEGDVKIDILRDDLASMVGTAKESISRMLTDFKTEKLIAIDKLGCITVLNREKLEKLPN